MVAADVSSAVEGWRPAARKERWPMRAIPKYSSAVGGFKRFIRRAGRPGSTAGRMPALRKGDGGRQSQYELPYLIFIPAGQRSLPVTVCRMKALTASWPRAGSDSRGWRVRWRGGTGADAG